MSRVRVDTDSDFSWPVGQSIGSRVLDFYETAGPKLFAEKVNEMSEGDPEIDREVADGPRKTFNHARSDTLQKMETATRLTRGYQPIEPHFGDVGTIRAIGEKFARVIEIVNRSEPDGRLIEQPKPDRQDGDGLQDWQVRENQRMADDLERRLKAPTRDAAEGTGPVVSLSDFAKTEWAGGVRSLTAPPQPAPDAVREALESLGDWCNAERAKIGAIDGFDYRSGEEFGLHCAEIEIAKRAAALAAPVLSADGAARWPRVFSVRRAEINSWHAYISFARFPTDKELQAVEAALSAPVPPAEPRHPCRHQ